MAGVPEATFPDWAARFLALGYKVARADERESALAKQMREKQTGAKRTMRYVALAGVPSHPIPRSTHPTKNAYCIPPIAKKIIDRKLAAVYTRGTLMGDFVIGDMSNYIMSIQVRLEPLI
jgi:DNA mismatch repair protein MSH6